MKQKIILLSLAGCLFLALLLPAYVTDAAPSTEKLSWGYKRSEDHLPPSPGEKFELLLEKYGAFYMGDPEKKEIYLTFDNGYEAGYTEDILDVLKEKEVPAAFFVTGHYVTDQPGLIKRMAEDGHIVGNHSWHHPDLTTKSESAIRRELNRVEEEIKRLTGEKGMSYVRPPQGTFSEKTLSVTRDMGYRHVFWSVAHVDWHADRQKGWESAYNEIMEQIHPGAIILLHTVSEDNAMALERVIGDLQDEGYVFKSLDDLMVHRFFPDSILIH